MLRLLPVLRFPLSPSWLAFYSTTQPYLNNLKLFCDIQGLGMLAVFVWLLLLLHLSCLASTIVKHEQENV